MVAFLEMHVLAVRISEMIDPCPFVETDSVHNKSIAVPFSNRRVAEPLRIGILRKVSAFDPDFTQHASPFEELQNAILCLDHLKRSAEKQDTRITERIALPRGVVSKGRRNGSRTVRWLVRIELLLPPCGHRRRVVSQALRVASPNSGKVVRVVWDTGTGRLDAASCVAPRALREREG